ncbi:uncharacterized protein scimp isoform X2 [Echeneis naucrates]|uniref:uncharacterized protein scimp isoform X2 n=1 Tax=Echeneis naucrates TaxID=173247 RepID=UPI0011143854|nr:uncharacterized protein LOC115054755 isoform X2 [Echeneis naucrates]
MALLRKYFLVWVICGMVFGSALISIIFILINKCLLRRGNHRISELQKRSVFNVESNKYQERQLGSPALPPRTQFLTTEVQSYENLAEAVENELNSDNCEQIISDYEEAMSGYEEACSGYEEPIPEYEEALPEYEEALPDYVEAQPDYEEPLDQQPDYLQVEDEVKVFRPPPPNKTPDTAEDNSSTEDYDDIGGEEGEAQDEEDYDDVA